MTQRTRAGDNPYLDPDDLPALFGRRRSPMASETVRLDERQLAQPVQALGKLTAAVEQLTAAQARAAGPTAHRGEAGPEVPVPRRYRTKT